MPPLIEAADVVETSVDGGAGLPNRRSASARARAGGQSLVRSGVDRFREMEFELVVHFASVKRTIVIPHVMNPAPRGGPTSARRLHAAYVACYST